MYIITFCTGDFGRIGTSEAYAEYSKFYAKKLHQRCQVKPSSISFSLENWAFVMFIYNSACFWRGEDICETQQNTRCNGEIASGAQAYEA